MSCAEQIALLEGINTKLVDLNASGRLPKRPTNIEIDGMVCYWSTADGTYKNSEGTGWVGAGNKYLADDYTWKTVTGYTDTDARLAISSSIFAIPYDNTTGEISLATGYFIPTLIEATYWDSKEDEIVAGTTAQYWRGDKSWQTLDTAIVSENGNLYYTQSRFDTAFGLKSTTNLIEGSNLYFTQLRARQSISETITGIDYDSTTGILSQTAGYFIPTIAQETLWTNKIDGDIAQYQVAFGTAADTIGGSANFRWGATANTLDITGQQTITANSTGNALTLNNSGGGYAIYSTTGTNRLKGKSIFGNSGLTDTAVSAAVGDVVITGSGDAILTLLSDSSSTVTPHIRFYNQAALTTIVGAIGYGSGVPASSDLNIVNKGANREVNIINDSATATRGIYLATNDNLGSAQSHWFALFHDRGLVYRVGSNELALLNRTGDFHLGTVTAIAGAKLVVQQSLTTGTNYGSHITVNGIGAINNTGLYVTATGATTNIAIDSVAGLNRFTNAVSIGTHTTIPTDTYLQVRSAGNTDERVITTANDKYARVVLSAGSVPNFLQIRANAPSHTGTTAGISNAALSIINALGSSALLVYTSEDKPIIFAVNNFEKGRFTSEGLNVGVSTGIVGTRFRAYAFANTGNNTAGRFEANGAGATSNTGIEIDVVGATTNKGLIINSTGWAIDVQTGITRLLGNVALFGAGSYGSGDKVLFMANAATVPTTNPTGGGILYVEAGALKYRGSSGTITTLGAA